VTTQNSEPVAAPEGKKRGRQSKPESNAKFYDGSVSAEGFVTNIAKPFESERLAMKASMATGNPYLKIEVLRADLGEDMKVKSVPVVAPASPAVNAAAAGAKK
jgi:hypothetical protein